MSKKISGSKKTKKPRKKKKPAKPKILTIAEIEAAQAAEKRRWADERVREEYAHETQMRADFEREHSELAPWIGWEAYQAARKNEKRIKAVGIIGAIMRGKKRSDIRKEWRISPNKLNAILNSEAVDNVLAYSLGHLYSFQAACVRAILWQLQEKNDAGLALTLLDKMGLFDRMTRIISDADIGSGAAMVPDAGGKEGAHGDAVGLLYAKGDGVQARQMREALERLVVTALKGPDTK